MTQPRRGRKSCKCLERKTVPDRSHLRCPCSNYSDKFSTAVQVQFCLLLEIV